MANPTIEEKPPEQLLAITWWDLSGTPLEAGAPTTAEQALANIIQEQMLETYYAQVDYHLERSPEARHPFGLEKNLQISDLSKQVAKNRLDQYEQRLTKYLQGQPSEDQLVEWLANRAINDANTWARLDSTYMRREANKDFFRSNPELKEGPFTIAPPEAAEERCQGVVGKLFDTYDEAEAALDDVWHYACVHFVERA